MHSHLKTKNIDTFFSNKKTCLLDENNVLQKLILL
jgi:hypothetical protein